LTAAKYGAPSNRTPIGIAVVTEEGIAVSAGVLASGRAGNRRVARVSPGSRIPRPPAYTPPTLASTVSPRRHRPALPLHPAAPTGRRTFPSPPVRPSHPRQPSQRPFRPATPPPARSRHRRRSSGRRSPALTRPACSARRLTLTPSRHSPRPPADSSPWPRPHAPAILSLDAIDLPTTPVLR
jgi:hypothetical protein